jgi:hypothetical protein
MDLTLPKPKITALINGKPPETERQLLAWKRITEVTKLNAWGICDMGLETGTLCTDSAYNAYVHATGAVASRMQFKDVMNLSASEVNILYKMPNGKRSRSCIRPGPLRVHVHS